MTPSVHDDYAKDLLLSLFDYHPEMDVITFVPNPSQSRNAAKAMTAILCHRLFKNSRQIPILRFGTTFEWKEGVFNCRNIADRGYLWTNMRRNAADDIHEIAESKAVAYLLACSDPGETKLSAWVLPEPLFHSSLSKLPPKKAGEEYTIQISTRDQRIEGFAPSPDLSQYYNEFLLSPKELEILNESRVVDASVRRERKNAKLEEDTYDDVSESVSGSKTNTLLKDVSEQLDETGAFDPMGIADARERVLASIVRRRGQPAFRQGLLGAYNGRCAVSDCDVDAVLDAAHILPYKGPETNHLGNGLLLRTDIHALFDLKLIAVDVATMTLLVSHELAGTCYDDFRGRPISAPRDGDTQPNRAALDQHRHDSGL